MGKTFRVLVIDPNTKSRDKIEQWLHNLGDVVCEKAQSSDLFAEIKPHWDLIIIRFDKQNHHELAFIQNIKDKTPTTAVLVIAENIRVEFIQTMLIACFLVPFIKRSFFKMRESYLRNTRRRKSTKVR